MARQLRLVILLHLARPPQAQRGPMRELAWRDCFEPLLGALHHTPDVKVGLVIAGDLVDDFQADHPEAIEWLRELIDRQQVELVGTAFHEPVLSAIPERDGSGQITSHATRMKRVYGVRPRGCWLPHYVWDPSLPRVLARAGMDWTVIEDRHLVNIGVDDEIYGVYRTEREGFGLAMLPIDTKVTELAANVPVKKVFMHLRRRAQRGHELVVIGLEASTFGLRRGRNPRADQTWLATLLAGISSATPAVQTVLPSEAVKQGPERGRVYVPSVAPVGVGVPWERALSRYDEANRLHKKMLRVSRSVYKLERLVKEGAHSDYRPDPEKLVQAHRYLYRAQSADGYWHHRHTGIYDPYLRAALWKDLLRAERVTLEAMRTHQRMLIETTDLDCDGTEEVVMRTPTTSVIIDPARSAGVTEFALYDKARNLVNTMTRVLESYHSDPAVMGDLGDADDTDTDEPSITGFEEDIPTVAGAQMGTSTQALARDLKRGLGRDRRARVCFLEQLLGPEVTLDAMRRGNYTETGRGFDTWQLVTHERKGDDALRAIFSTDVFVGDPGGERRARVNKRYTLRREPHLEMRLEMINRSHEALRSRLAVELNLTLDPDPETWSLVVGGQIMSIEIPSDCGDVSELKLEGEDLTLAINVERAARLWYYPINTIHRSGSEVRRATQGVCLVFQWPIELWGKEKDRVVLSIEATTED